MTSAELALRLCSALIGLCLVQQSAELLRIEQAWARGVYAAERLSDDLRALPRLFAAPLGTLYSARGFRALSWLRLGLGGLLVITPSFPCTVLALLASVVTCMRFRGTFNGGSDSMTVAVLVGLCLAGPGGPHARLGLTYVAVQLLLSYTIAGVVKLLNPRWRDGTALPAFMAIAAYGVPLRLQRALAQPGLARMCSWTVIGFECAMPAALLDVRACLALLAIAFGFHVGTALAFGLNRFLWAWCAAYPALLWLSSTAFSR
jgi:hypothetical protein